ncbi:MAG: GFA family protein [Granulosicoccus sp.]
MSVATLRTVQGRCHCRAVTFEVDLDDENPDLRRCNCSLCRRKSAVMAGVPIGRFRIHQGADKLSLYQWNEHIARHYFCSICGIYTHHQRRSNPLEIGINTGCFEGVSIEEFTTDVMGDGAAMSLVQSK